MKPDVDEILTYVRKSRELGNGSIGDNDMEFLFSMIRELRPRCTVEVGVASGFSTALFILALAKFNPAAMFYAFDCNTQCYFDLSKPVGYMVPALVPNPGIFFELRTLEYSFDVEAAIGKNLIDLCFVDANHNHPWPTFDTMILLPLMQFDSWCVHHDVNLYRNPEYASAIGPYHIFEKWPSQKRLEARETIGAIQKKLSHRMYEHTFMSVLEIPWTIGHHVGKKCTDRILAALNQHYSRSVAEHVAMLIAKHDATIDAASNTPG